MDSKINVILEDSIMQKGQLACAGSQILKNFISPLDATVVEKLNQLEISITGRVSMDEFGVCNLFPDSLEDDLTEDHSLKETHASAQTSEAVKVVASDHLNLALCNDIFGKTRSQASLNGLSYIQPTYGTVSRYGLIPTASSMDQIGILCADPADGFSLLSKISGKDEKDGAMYPDHSYDYSPYTGKIRLAVPENVWADQNTCFDNREILSSLENKFETKHMELKYFELYRQVLYILSCAEICNNTNRYDGIKFGCRAKDYKGISDLYINTRSEALGLSAKLAIIMGAAVLSQDNYDLYYEKAMKIRRLIRESLTFDDIDVIALPAQSNGTRYEQSAIYALTALAGLPSITIPFGESGIQLIANAKREDIIYGAWQMIK